jgi:putative CRISPR-associated protein (TIGR02620 family)
MLVTITRHQGAVEFIRVRLGRESIRLTEYNADFIEASEPLHSKPVIVAGVLPLHLALDALARGWQVFLVQFPERSGPRGQEMTAEEMERSGAKLMRFGLKVTYPWVQGPRTDWVAGAHHYAMSGDETVEIALEEI